MISPTLSILQFLIYIWRDLYWPVVTPISCCFWACMRCGGIVESPRQVPVASRSFHFRFSSLPTGPSASFWLRLCVIRIQLRSCLILTGWHACFSRAVEICGVSLKLDGPPFNPRSRLWKQYIDFAAHLGTEFGSVFFVWTWVPQFGYQSSKVWSVKSTKIVLQFTSLPTYTNSPGKPPFEWRSLRRWFFMNAQRQCYLTITQCLKVNRQKSHASLTKLH